jgi:HPt (histidine-containing phosphotransfer) domain-containing protein
MVTTPHRRLAGSANRMMPQGLRRRDRTDATTVDSGRRAQTEDLAMIGQTTARAIDRAHLAEQTAGDADLAAELLGLFAGQCDRLLPIIADTAGERVARAEAAHTLKGAAAGVGAGEIRALCDRIEAGLRAGTEPGTAGLREAVARVLAEIADAA